MENTPDFSKCQIKALIVEDDAVSRILLFEILKNCGIVSIMTRNGKEAVEIIESDKSINLILMDIKMPIMDGYLATMEIRKLGFNKTIIAQTAYAGSDDSDRILSEGFDALVTKPIDKVKLIEILTKIYM